MYLNVAISLSQESSLWVTETGIHEVIICEPHRELICPSKWHQSTSAISAPQEIGVVIYFLVHHSSKTTLLFLPADEEASWLLFTVFLLSSSTLQPIAVSPRWQVRHEKAKKVNINYSYHQCSSAWVSLDWSYDSDWVWTILIGKDGLQGSLMW